MQSRIDDLLEALWNDIKAGLNNDQDGLDLKKLESLLQTYSRHILSDLGKNNIQALPPAVVENIFKYIFPQGIDPLISSLLSYLKINRAEEEIYLDPLSTIREATQNLRGVLESISRIEIPIANLAWLEYRIYQNAITAWQDVLQRTYDNVKHKLMLSEVYLLIREELAQCHGKISRELVNWERYEEIIKKRKTDLMKLRETLDNRPNELPASFFSTPMAKWKELMLFTPETEAYWISHWEKRENPRPSSSLLSTYLHSSFQTSKTIVAATLNFTGIKKGTWYLKTDKQLITEMIDKRINSYQETIRACQTLLAINKARTLIIPKESMLSAQIHQLNHLEIYLTSVMSVLTNYADNSKQLESNGSSVFLKIKAWLGFKKAIEECQSSKNLAATKALSFTKVSNSTLNILNAVKQTKTLPRHHWNDTRFQIIKTHIDKFHNTISTETEKLTSTYDTHNEKFRNEWYFWQRKTMLPNLFESISRNCPVGPQVR